MKKTIALFLLLSLALLVIESYALDLQQGHNDVVCPVCTGPVNNPCTSCASWSLCTAGTQKCSAPLPSGCTGNLTQPCTMPGGTYSTQWASALSLDKETGPGSGVWGYLSTLIAGGDGDYNLPPGTTWMKISNPSGKTPIQLQVVDYNQNPNDYFSVVAYPLDSSYNMLTTVPGMKKIPPFVMGLNNGQGSLPNMPGNILWLIKFVNNAGVTPLSINYR